MDSRKEQEEEHTARIRQTNDDSEINDTSQALWMTMVHGSDHVDDEDGDDNFDDDAGGVDELMRVVLMNILILSDTCEILCL